MARHTRTLRGAAVLVLLAVPSGARGQPSPEPADAAVDPATAPPTLLSRVEAAYPPDALHDRLEAAVGVELVVDADGKVVDARVTTPAGHGFDEAALAAARAFTFEPARRNGVAIRSTVQFAYEFHLPDAPVQGRLPDAPAPNLQVGPDQSTLVVSRPSMDAPPAPNAASDSTTRQAELALRPRMRAEGLLEVVPGLFSVQHAGGGKAQQDFVRGFNVDHGTDLAFFVDDVPINAVSHAHGQGYSDLHFLIPEAVARVDSTKGPYAAAVGDFGTAGAVSFRMADHTNESLAKLELAPSTGHERLVVVESPDFGAGWRMVVAAEAFHENGPFIHPEGFERVNGYAKVTRVFDAQSDLSLMAMAYGGSWSMSGALPARAVCGEGDGTPAPAAYAGTGCISRWDSVDPTQGGASQRGMLWAQYRRQFDTAWELRTSAYAVRSNLQLFPNDGVAAPFQPDGVEYGSQIEQDDARTQTGVNVKLTHRAVLGGVPVRTALGLQFRNDDIEAQLHRTRARTRLDGIDANIPGPIYDGHTNETETGAYLEEELRPARWLRFVLGARADRIDVATTNESATAVDRVSGYDGCAQLSPKASAVVSPSGALDLFANYGRGFHSNDARTVVEGQATTLIAAATGYEVGATLRPWRGLSLSAAGFLIDLTSELTIDGDTATLVASGPTRRYGIEASGRYDLDERIYADVSFSAARSLYTDAADADAGKVYLPDAPIRTFSAAVGFRQPAGAATLLGSVTVRSMSDRYGDSGPAPLVETGWTVVNAEAGVRWNRFELVADLFNLGDVAWREGQFEVDSRLPKENPTVAPRPGISFTPGMPRTLMVHGAVYW